jgi:hypothetical protein
MKKALKGIQALIISSLAILLLIPGTIMAANYIGNAFQIAADNTLDEVTPSIAYSSQRQEYLVVWSNDRPGCDDIQGQRLASNGDKINPPFYISNGCPNDRWYPDVAYDGQHDHYLVVWQYYEPTVGYGIKGRRVNGDGVVLDTSDILIFSGGPGIMAYPPAVTYSHTSNRFLVVYKETLIGGSFIRGQQLGSNGTLVGTPNFIIASNPVKDISEPDVAYNLNANRFLVVWQHEFSATDYDIHGQQVTGEGALWGSQITGIADSWDNETNPAVAALSESPTVEKFFVVYESDYSSPDHSIVGSLLYEDGTVDFTGMIMSNIGNGTNPAVTASNSSLKYFVTWRIEEVASYTGIVEGALAYDGSMLDDSFFRMAGDYMDHPAVVAGPIGDILLAWQDQPSTPSINLYGQLFGNRNYLPLIRH